jgi:SPP1 gp7 family putative phage head morphogenesis protein
MAKKPPATRPVWPSAAIEAWYRTELQKMVRTMSRELYEVLRAAWKSAETVSDGAMDAKRPSIDLLRRALDKWGGLWTRRLESLSDKLANEFANKSRTYTDRALKQAFSDAGLTVKFQPTKGMLEGYAAVVHENVGLIKSIPQKYLTDVQSVVWTNVMKGGDLKAMAEGIEHTYGVTKRRAAFIARDQNNKAKAVFERERDKELGVTHFIWVHSHAGKEPRPTHVRAAGKKYSIEKGMYDSDEGKYVFPGELINCRCTQRAILPGWDD